MDDYFSQRARGIEKNAIDIAEQQLVSSKVERGIRHTTSCTITCCSRLDSRLSSHSLVPGRISRNSLRERIGISSFPGFDDFSRKPQLVFDTTNIRRSSNGFNVLLFGVGSKTDLLDEFSTSCLTQFCRVTVRGFQVRSNYHRSAPCLYHPSSALRQPSVCVRSVLATIAREILEISATRDIYRLALSIVAELQKSCRDIYIVGRPDTKMELRRCRQIFHNIDGPSFRSAEAQDVIAILAESPGVHLIASIDHVRAPLRSSLSCRHDGHRNHCSIGQFGTRVDWRNFGLRGWRHILSRIRWR